ncbi:MAG TPA: HAMP domain-containing sensor histidine kinase [Bacteroidia bacterium]|nr:HAMP domain-containing sensor histidine kinase [Bacteroidia bacterium]
MKKLLNRTIWPFALYSLIVLAVSVPVYFFIVEQIWEDELDEHHWITKNKVEQELNTEYENPAEIPVMLEQFNRLNLGSTIRAMGSGEHPGDSVYSHYRFDPYYNEVERFRVLSAQIKIHNEPYRLIIETNIEESEETVLAIATVAISFFLILLLGFFWLNRNLSRKIWKPFYSTLDKLKTFDLSGEKGIVTEQTDVLEFEELNKALHVLIEKNVSVFRQQKEFTENASHELQTPLAILKSKVDLLLQDETLTQEQSEKIEALNAPLSRVSRINKNLLILARIENQKFADHTEDLDIGALVNESLEFIADQVAGRHITISKEISTEVTVHANRSLLETVILNLLLNAIRHNVEKGVLHISLTDKKLVVSNSGTASLNTDSLFQRFASTSRVSPGSGLGLALVHEICRRYGWKVAYRFEKDMHIFAVQF